MTDNIQETDTERSGNAEFLAPECSQESLLLYDLIAATENYVRLSHSGACMDFNKPGWPVTRETCKCEKKTVKLRESLEAAKRHLGII